MFPGDQAARCAGSERSRGASERPALSVVIPTYQRESTLGRALKSALNQTFPAAEVIVVDDGSTDGTRELLRSYPSVRTVWQHQAGSAAARNRGVQVAAAPWIAFLDSDDWWEPDHLERLASAIEETEGRADLYFDDTAAVMHTHQPDGDDVHVGSLWRFAGFATKKPVTFVQDASAWVLLPVQPIMLQSSAIRTRYLVLGGMSSRLLLRHDTHLFLCLGLGRPACAVHGVGSRMSDDGVTDGSRTGSPRVPSRTGMRRRCSTRTCSAGSPMTAPPTRSCPNAPRSLTGVGRGMSSPRAGLGPLYHRSPAACSCVLASSSTASYRASHAAVRQRRPESRGAGSATQSSCRYPKAQSRAEPDECLRLGRVREGILTENVEHVPMVVDVLLVAMP